MSRQSTSAKFETCFPDAARIAVQKSVAVANNIESDIDWGRICVESLLYISIVCRVFGQQLGVLNITGLSGILVVLSGFVCLFVMMAKREPFPLSLIFVFLMNVVANMTDLVIVGLLSRDMIYWMSTLLMACYVVKDHRAALRFEIFLALIVLLSLAIGGVFVSQAREHERLALKDQIVGAMFANSNALAQIAYMTGIALLFFSIKSGRGTKLFCWCLFIALAAVVLLTLSRQGLILLCLGFVFYLIAAMSARGGKTDIAVLILLAIAIAFVYGNEFEKIVGGYEYRLSLGSDRTAYWATAQHDMAETLLSGKGSFNAFSSAGILPHNTFLWVHLAYGGFCAWIFVAWMICLIVKTFQITFRSDTELAAKIQVIALMLLFFMGQLTTIFAPGNYGYILGIALLEQHFAPQVSPESG